MKLLITLSLMWFSIAKLQAQSISHIETTKNWYYIYDQNGKKVKTLGKLIRCLYATSDTKPPYKKIQQFFGIDKKVNLGGATKIPSYNKPAEAIIQLLESCGFKM